MSARRFALLTFVGVLLMQGAWIAVVPPFRGSDEIDHAYRAAAVAGGQWRATVEASQGRGRLVEVPAALVQAARPQCEDLSYQGIDNCEPVARTSGDQVLVASSAWNYEPIFYWIAGAPSLLFSGYGALYAMRCVCALLCATLIAAGSWCLGLGTLTTWSRAAGFLTLSPVVLYSTIVVAPNGLEICAGFALWSALLAASRRTSENYAGIAVVGGIGAIILAGLRMLGPGFLALSLALAFLFWRRQLWVYLRRRSRLCLCLGGAALLAGIFQILWALRWQVTPDVGALIDSASTGVGSSTRPWVPDVLILAPLQMIAAFPFRDQPAPVWVYPAFMVLLLVLLASALIRGSRRAKIILLLFGSGLILLPVIVTAITYDGRGVMWQGRYALPLAVGLPLMASYALVGWKSRRRNVTFVVAGALLAALHFAGMTKVLMDERQRHVSVMSVWLNPPVWAIGVAVTAAWSLFVIGVLRGSDG